MSYANHYTAVRARQHGHSAVRTLLHAHPVGAIRAIDAKTRTIETPVIILIASPHCQYRSHLVHISEGHHYVHRPTPIRDAVVALVGSKNIGESIA